MGVLWFVVGIIILVLAVGGVVFYSYMKNSSATAMREKNYRRELAAIENRKAKALLAGDAFKANLADKDAVILRDRYIAGKDV